MLIMKHDGENGCHSFRFFFSCYKRQTACIGTIRTMVSTSKRFSRDVLYLTEQLVTVALECSIFILILLIYFQTVQNI